MGADSRITVLNGEPMRELFRRLVETPGASGFEEAVIRLVAEEFRKSTPEVTVDGLGNVLAKIPGSGKRSVLVCVHTDEVSLLVKYIDPKGYLYFDLNGWIDERVLFSTRVDVCADARIVPGVIGVKSRHLMSAEDMRRPVSVQDLWIDVGADSREDVQAWGIRIGDPVVFHPNFTAIGDHTIISKAVDNRAGCAILVETAKRLKGKKLDYTLYLVAAVQEEVGSRGARVVAQALGPDMAVALDTLPAADPATPPQQATGESGKGPVIRSMDMNAFGQGTIYSRKIQDRIIRVAEENRIPYQRDIFRTWTDASTIHTAGQGIPTGGIFIPRRYSHSPAELVKWSDLEHARNLLVGFLEGLNSEIINDLIRKV
ncbi:MAG: peptidase family protein [Candidatus Aminicenantes bacterium]|nr:peptidase family protein [Candidatus Aminicenantes bacterium]